MRLNWANYKFLAHDGYGRMGRGFVRALTANGHEVYPFTIDELDMPAWYQRARGLEFDKITIQLMPPHHMLNLPGRSVGFSMHESMTLPDGWANHINQKCEHLIVPGVWLVDLFKEAGVKVPIVVVPGGVDIEECPIIPVQQYRRRPYTFGCLADRGGRKGDRRVYSAFYQAFDHNNKDVRLLIKCRPEMRPPNLDFSYSSDPRLTLWTANVEHVSDLYAQMDAFMFPSHCEGYGMPPREAAACGLPTVVTRFSGTADDCDEWAIPLNKFTMVESGMDGCGGKWAIPDMDELIETMRWLYTHQDEAKQRALQSAQWMRHNATYAHAADKLVDVFGDWFGRRRPEIQPMQTIAVNGNGHKHEAIAL